MLFLLKSSCLEFARFKRSLHRTNVQMSTPIFGVTLWIFAHINCTTKSPSVRSLDSCMCFCQLSGVPEGHVALQDLWHPGEVSVHTKAWKTPLMRRLASFLSICARNLQFDTEN